MSTLAQLYSNGTVTAQFLFLIPKHQPRQLLTEARIQKFL